MYQIVVGIFAVFVTFTCAADLFEKQTTAGPPKDIIQIVHSETVKRPDGSYDFQYQGEDGTIREEGSVVMNPGSEDESTDVHGSYKYIDSDGKEVEVHYTAGKNGFVPYGTNIPAEITANAKAAADLPSQDYDDDEKTFKKKVKVVSSSKPQPQTFNSDLV